MGMGAGQARFLGLTARKNNVEYEGQQINQQRTTLSNQSANYYNGLLGMSVPTPPSVDSFTKTVYSFDDGALKNTVTALIAQGGTRSGEYAVSYLRQWNDDFSPVASSSSVISKNDSGVYSVGSKELRKLSFYDAAGKVVSSIPKDASGKYTGTDAYLKKLTPEEITALEKEEAYQASLLDGKYGNDKDGWLVRYTENTSTGKQVPYFYKSSAVKSKADGGTGIYSETGTSQNNIPCYTMGTTIKTEEVKAKDGVRVEKDSTGRYISITLPKYDADGNAIRDAAGNPIADQTYTLSTNTITDQDAYDDAMNQYEYKKFQYDQSINDINSKIAIIQTQDKDLELRLKQLDTEQKAISTEMDSVSKVIQKNVESSFKTFG